jgi:hypothetical protein
MALQGTLDAFGLAEVLQLLSVTGKTGCLRVEGDGGRGDVWLRDGMVTAASSDRVSGPVVDEVICDLLRYETGSFAFEIDMGAPETALPKNVDDLLDRADMLLAEWEELEAVVPSLDHQVGLVEQLSPGEAITVSARQWPALVAVGQGCTVSELAATLGLTELSALRTVHDLVTSGLTTIRAARPATQRRRAGTRLP